MGGSLPAARREVAGHRYVRVFDRQWQVRQTGQRRATSGWAYDAPGQPDVRLSRRTATGGAGYGRGVPWREGGSKRDRAQSACRRVKKIWPSASGGLERRKERPCGRSRCMQDDAGRLQRLTGDNVRPLMRPAQRQGEAQGGSTQRGAWERIREGRPQSGRSDAHKKSPCSFLQGRNMVGHQGLEPRTN